MLSILMPNLNLVSHPSMVVSENKLASDAGADILRKGGNAFDAAVAVGYALAVANPCCGNIGGGGFMTIYTSKGESLFINFREKAPRKATQNMFLDSKKNFNFNKSQLGYLAIAVPGTVLGLDSILQKFGTLSREIVMAPAISLAENGFPLTDYAAKLLKQYEKDFEQQPNVAAIFLPQGRLLKEGDYLIQKNLAKTLKLIARYGPDYFYRGPIAETIVAESKKKGGILSLADFKTYQIKQTTPVTCTYRGYTIISAPPPSSGGITLCETLNILENFPPYDLSANSIIRVAAALGLSFADRNSKLGDPDFINIPIHQLLSKKYAKELAQSIDNYHITQYQHVLFQQELSDTTHYSIADKFGNAISVTYTLNGFFGSSVIAGDTGFFLNDEMDDFTAKVGEENKFGLRQLNNNKIVAGKQPLSSMTPTIVLKNKKVLLVIGSPGGPRIISTVLLTLLNLLDVNMSLQEATQAPRFHYQLYPDTLFIEPFSLSFLARIKLKDRGFHITQQNYWGAIEAILIDPSADQIIGVNDMRRPDGGIATAS